MVGATGTMFPAAYQRMPISTPPTNLNYTNTARNHLNNPNRFVPQEILKGVIEQGKPLPDPQGSNAIMYYDTIWRNGTQYNIEVLYDHNTNTVMHFMYTQKPIGPMPRIVN